jgi:predicted DNA-binding protein (UPF0251 family)
MRELEEVEFLPDELEAIKLHDVDDLEQIESAKKMNVSQPTFGRILDRAYKKIAESYRKRKAIKISKKIC